jgi:hypothetical protein
MALAVERQDQQNCAMHKNALPTFLGGGLTVRAALLRRAAFLDVSSLNLAALSGAAIFFIRAPGSQLAARSTFCARGVEPQPWSGLVLSVTALGRGGSPIRRERQHEPKDAAADGTSLPWVAPAAGVSPAPLENSTPINALPFPACADATPHSCRPRISPGYSAQLRRARTSPQTGTWHRRSQRRSSAGIQRDPEAQPGKEDQLVDLLSEATVAAKQAELKSTGQPRNNLGIWLRRRPAQGVRDRIWRGDDG